MLATHHGFTAVPQQGAQNGSRQDGQTSVENAALNGVAIVPFIKQRLDQQGAEGAERRHLFGPVGRASRSGFSEGWPLTTWAKLPGRLIRSDWVAQLLQPSVVLGEDHGPAARSLRWGGPQGHRSLRGERVRPAGPGAARLATGLGAVLAAALSAGWLTPLRAEPAPRPADLKILVEKTTMREGTHWLGVYGRVAEPDQPGLWRVKLWREWSDRVEISTETIDCRPGRATRAGVTASKVVVQTLNPGGPINPANRLDHLIWWATCFPEQAGRDPAGLGPLARSLGFDGRQQEHFEVLAVPPLPHP